MQRFFGCIRQAGAQNVHQTFVLLYNYILSVYKLLKPPQFGNCKEPPANENLHEETRISFHDFLKAYVERNKRRETYKSQHILEINKKN